MILTVNRYVLKTNLMEINCNPTEVTGEHTYVFTILHVHF